MINQKLPEPGEWWISYCDAIAYICGFDPDGDPVFLTDRKENAHVDTMSGFLENWHHEPLCTGWDWKPPAPIDPGEGWELLPAGTVIDVADECFDKQIQKWYRTISAGLKVGEKFTAGAYRRRKPPAEVWPKWYRWDVDTTGFVFRRMENGAVFTHQLGFPAIQSDDWSVSLAGAFSIGGLIEISEAEAIARLKPAEPVAAERVPDHRPAREVIREIVRLIADSSMTDEESADMAFQIGKQWLDDNPEDPPPFAKPFTDPRSGMGIQKDHVSWRPNGQRHEVATEVTYHAETPAESPDDWVTQDRVPARPGIDERRYHYSSGDISAWADSACMDWNRPVMNRAPIKYSGGWVELRCRRRDLPAQPAPIDHERWFMWSDDRYPIAFVKRAGGKVFNLNVDGMFKTSDDWGASYEEKLINGELIEVTEESAKAYLKRPRRKIIDPPAPQPKRTPVRLWHNPDSEDGMVFVSDVRVLAEDQEIKCGPSGFYVEEVE